MNTIRLLAAATALLASVLAVSPAAADQEWAVACGDSIWVDEGPVSPTVVLEIDIPVGSDAATLRRARTDCIKQGQRGSWVYVEPSYFGYGDLPQPWCTIVKRDGAMQVLVYAAGMNIPSFNLATADCQLLSDQLT